MVSPRRSRQARRRLHGGGRDARARGSIVLTSSRPAKSVRVLVYHPTEAADYARLIKPPRGGAIVHAARNDETAPRGRVVVHLASNADEAAKFVAEVDVLYAWQFPPALYAKAMRLRWLQAMAAGVDWALVPELPRHVVVTRTPGIFGPWMAEYVLGWCLWVTQRMGDVQEAQRARRWRGDLVPERLAGKTLVIVGLGDVGRTIARAARSLGVRVVGVTRSGRRVPGVDRVVRSSGLRHALREGDFVVVTAPLTPSTRGLIGAVELSAMRPDAWLVNVARGAVIDEAALVDALRAERIRGAILDVFAEEPLPRDHPFWAMPNVVITPHVAGPSTPGEIAPIFNDNLAQFMAGRRLRYVVDRARGY